MEARLRQQHIAYEVLDLVLLERRRRRVTAVETHSAGARDVSQETRPGLPRADESAHAGQSSVGGHADEEVRLGPLLDDDRMRGACRAGNDRVLLPPTQFARPRSGFADHVPTESVEARRAPLHGAVARERRCGIPIPGDGGTQRAEHGVHGAAGAEHRTQGETRRVQHVVVAIGLHGERLRGALDELQRFAARDAPPRGGDTFLSNRAPPIGGFLVPHGSNMAAELGVGYPGMPAPSIFGACRPRSPTPR